MLPDLYTACAAILNSRVSVDFVLDHLEMYNLRENTTRADITDGIETVRFMRMEWPWNAPLTVINIMAPYKAVARKAVAVIQHELSTRLRTGSEHCRAYEGYVGALGRGPETDLSREYVRLVRKIDFHMRKYDDLYFSTSAVCKRLKESERQMAHSLGIERLAVIAAFLDLKAVTRLGFVRKRVENLGRADGECQLVFLDMHSRLQFLLGAGGAGKKETRVVRLILKETMERYTQLFAYYKSRSHQPLEAFLILTEMRRSLIEERKSLDLEIKRSEAAVIDTVPQGKQEVPNSEIFGPPGSVIVTTRYDRAAPAWNTRNITRWLSGIPIAADLINLMKERAKEEGSMRRRVPTVRRTVFKNTEDSDVE